jgi:hypothetical protein
MSMALPTFNPAWTHRAKSAVANTALLALGVAFEILSRDCDEMRQEIASWEEGRTFALGVLPNGPAIAVRKQGDRLVLLGRGDHRAPLRVLFKNVDAALLVLTGLLSAHMAFAESRAIVHGPLDETMQTNRAMAIVVKFLFPGPMLGALLKRKPTFSPEERRVKALFYAKLGPALAARLVH